MEKTIYRALKHNKIHFIYVYFNHHLKLS